MSSQQEEREADKVLRTRAKAMRHEPTLAEAALWRILRAKRLEAFKFKRQVPIGRYIADFVNFDRRLIIEADGGQHSDSAYDEARDAWLKGQGFEVLRFWNNDVLGEADGVATVILNALEALR